MPFVDPLDEATVLRPHARPRIVTVEEGIVTGGLGAAVASLVSQNQPVPMRILGITGFALPAARATCSTTSVSTPTASPRQRMSSPDHISPSTRARRPPRPCSSTPPARSSRGLRPVALSTPRPGWVEQDANEIWASVKAAVASCLSDADPRRVAAVGLSTQRESLLLWDRSSGSRAARC